VFTNNNVIVRQDGSESVVCSRFDGIGIGYLKKLNIKSYIISSETNDVVKKRAEKINIDCINSVQDKAKEIINLSSRLSIDLKNIMFVGNDVNDIPALEIVGFPIGVSDSHKDIFDYVNYLTNNKGGEGAVREICDIFLSLYDHGETK
jgi:YrbI family 3-deoxy-D-manno-octulosonate 8-phosphate phosphatase